MSRAVANPLLVEAEADPYVRRPPRRAVERRSGRRWRWWRGSAGQRMSRAGEGRRGDVREKDDRDAREESAAQETLMESRIRARIFARRGPLFANFLKFAK